MVVVPPRSGEPQHGIVGIGHATGIVPLITLLPQALSGPNILKDLHCSDQHQPLPSVKVDEADTRLRVSLELSHPPRRRVRAEPESFQSFVLASVVEKLGQTFDVETAVLSDQSSAVLF